MQSGARAKVEKQSNEKLGLSVRPLSPEERKRAEVSGGLLAEDVAQDGPAARAGIRPGDIILAVNGDKVASVDEMRSLLAKHRKQAALLILRNKQRLFVPIDLG
ncbi:MAG TPA: PDZ domain-containing protein [Gallionellaceae bacterium]